MCVVEPRGSLRPQLTRRSMLDSVKLVLVNTLGQRVRVPGKLGQTVAEAAASAGFDDLRAPCCNALPQTVKHTTAGGWVEPKFGEGAYCSHCMVIVPQDRVKAMPPVLPDEAERLAEYPFKDEMTTTSRLACRVKITKEMDGMTVFVPNGADYETPDN